MKEILLTQNQVTLVSDWRYDFLNQWKWCAQWKESTKSYYAIRADYSSGKQKMIGMHNVILGILKGGDHINGITLDNQDHNLRPDPEHRNVQNSKIRSDNTSGYKGVTWNKRKNKWEAQIMFKNKKYHVGYFDIVEDAARARDKKALELHGEFARLNSFT